MTDETELSKMEIQVATGGLPPSPNQELTPVERVFQNDLLLDKILHFAMMEDDKEEKQKTTNSCKLVRHLWLERVDAALGRSRGSKQRLLRFHSKRPDLVKKFVDAFATSPPTLVYRIPPFTLVYDGRPRLKFSESTRNSLLKCLTNCGSGLVQLELVVVNKQWFSYLESVLYPLALTPLELPNLKKITVKIDSTNDSSFQLEDVTARIKLFIQSILDGCECLKEISLICIGNKQPSAIFEHLKLPLTLAKVNFLHRLAPGLLAKLLVVNQQLPNLIALTLDVYTSKCIVANELTQVLTQYRHQLQELIVWVDTSVDAPQKIIVFPVMERLQVFKCTAKSIEWSTLDSLSLDNYFPALKRIHLRHITYGMWQKWLQNSTFSSVEEGRFSLKLPAFGIDNDHLLLLEQMQKIKQTFPNIVDLSLTIPFTKQTPHIKFIFQKIRQLQKLYIWVTNLPVNMSFNEFDAWFLNLNPHEDQSTIIAQREEWKKLTQGNMTDLRRLEICFRDEEIDDGTEYLRSVLRWNFEQVEESDDESNEKSDDESDEESDEN